MVIENDLSSLQTKAAAAISDFQLFERFNPLFADPHIQSIGGFLARQRGIGSYVPKTNGYGKLLAEVTKSLLTSDNTESIPFWDSRERIETPDGDWFHADSKRSETADHDDTTTPTLVLIHGLESNSESPLTIEMAQANIKSMHVTCINFRGCSGEPNDSIGGYHLGFTDDVKHYLTILKQRRPDAPVYLAGFSLGANVVLKCLGELKETAVTDWNIHGAVALAAPLDQELNAKALAQPGVNRLVYTNMLLKSLKRKAQFQLDRFCNGDPNTTAFDYRRGMAAETITDFDDAFIAPIYGFRDCWDYYRQTSSRYFLDSIAVPTLVLNAKDDPFFDPNSWPATAGDHIRLERMESGGHLGFGFHQLESDVVPETSWAPHQMALFFQHIHNKRSVPV